MSHAPVAFTLPAVALLLLLASLAYITARRGWVGTLPRTGRLGLHTPAASTSDDAFRLANKVAAPVVGGAAVVAGLLALLTVFLPLPTAGTVVIAVLGLIAVPALLIAGGIQGEKAARTLPVPARRPQPGPACDGCACGGGGCAGLTRTAVPIEAATDAQ